MGTIKASHIQSNSGNDITVDKGFVITGGVTATGDLYSPSITAHNYIINGDMAIAQVGTSFAAVASGTYNLDCWVYAKSGDAVHTITQDTTVPTGTPFKYSLKLDCTTADSSIAAGDYCLFGQRIEGYNFVPMVGKTVTLSFWVSDSKIGIHCVTFLNSGADRSYVAEYTINVANTLEFKTITVPMNFSGGTWDYTTGIGLSIYFTLSCGSTYQTTANAWQTGCYYATANQVNGTDSTDNNFYITGVGLNDGSVAMPFRLCGGSRATEIILCQRYYEKSYDLLTAPGTNTTNGVFYSPAPRDYAVEERGMQFKVSKRSAPTMHIYSYTGAIDKCWNGSDRDSVAGYVGTEGFGYITIAGGDVNNSALYHWTADSRL